MYIQAPPPSHLLPTPPTDSSTLTTPGQTATRLPTALYCMGWVSLLTDISSEMVVSILPVYLYTVLQLPIATIGFVDGLYQSAAALLRLLAAYWADRWQRVKMVAVVGYGLSLIAKGFLILSVSGGFLWVLIGLGIDRLGKGIRTAPRDSLIASQVSNADLGRAFGVHRTMDGIGALIAPFLASTLLSVWFNRYDYLFIVSAVFALLGLWVLWFKVPSQTVLNRVVSAVNNDDNAGVTAPSTPIVTTRPIQANTPLSLLSSIQQLCTYTHFVRLIVASVLLNTFTISDGLLYLSVQQKLQLPSHFVSLMAGAAACSFTLSAYLLGKRSDQSHGFIGSFLAGAYGGLTLLYLTWSLFIWQTPAFDTSTAYAIVLCITLGIGLFYGATEGVIVANIAKQLPRHTLTSGLAIYTTALSAAKLGSSALYGVLWQSYGPSQAFWVFTVGLMVCGIIAAYLWRKQ